MKHAFAFFDVDCCEADTTGAGLTFRPRVQPIADKVTRLHEVARKAGFPLVFTTCCSGRMPRPGALPEVLHVARTAADTTWIPSVDQHRLFHLEKLTCGEARANHDQAAFDPFRHNPGAIQLVHILDAGEWIVFGNGFDFCVNSTVRGLLAAGQKVRLITDVLIPAATGYGPSGTEENRLRILGELRAGGMTETSLDAMLEDFGA